MFKKIIVSILILLLVIGTYLAYQAYKYVYAPNIFISGQKKYIYIPTGSDFEDVVSILIEENILKHRASFEWTAYKKKYHLTVKPGRYLIHDKMNNNELVNLLRSGKQVPVKVTWTKVRQLEKLASLLDKKLELDSSEFMALISKKEFLDSLGISSYEVLGIFIPNTYEFYWNTNARQFIYRMKREFERFWNEERLKKAKQLNMTPMEVMTLASIVEEETTKGDEKPTIAGVYINRLDIGMLLQADPTVRFACGDFTIRRVLNKHKEIESPFNTYKNYGLPPGPICTPSISSIDAVLNYKKHNFLYFCAKADFSGYHHFSKTFKEHQNYARQYQQKLNEKRIYK